MPDLVAGVFTADAAPGLVEAVPVAEAVAVPVAEAPPVVEALAVADALPGADTAAAEVAPESFVAASLPGCEFLVATPLAGDEGSGAAGGVDSG
jgi:hypothetical protein